MTNDLEQFSEELLKFMIESDHAQTGDVSALARIALAVQQAKPDYHIVRRLFTDAYGTHVELDVYLEQLDASKRRDDHGGVIIPVYTTPQPAHTERSGWIKCSEQMPDKYVEVVLYCPETKEQFIGIYDGHDFVYAQGPEGVSIILGLSDVSHWQPCVDAPKPESE